MQRHDAGPADTGIDSATAVLTATRSLLWISTPAEAKAAALELIAALGGAVVMADAADSEALPVDVSFGDGEPMLPWAPRGNGAKEALVRHLPSFVRDAHRAVELAHRADRLAEDAAIDMLTGLPNRRKTGRALGRLRDGEVVIVLDLDHFKEVNDTLGHEEGDEVLRAFGHTLASTVRARDHAGRYGGEEFVVILSSSAGVDPGAFLSRLRVAWEHARPHSISFSAGIAHVGIRSEQAFAAADQAMYQAKKRGRDRWVWAGGGMGDDRDDRSANDRSANDPGRRADDPAADPGGDHQYGRSGELDEAAARLIAPSPVLASVQPPSADPDPSTFVAYTRLTVDEVDDEAADEGLRVALEDHRAAVEASPGFQRLEAWTDAADPSTLLVVSWWDSEADFSSFEAAARSDRDDGPTTAEQGCPPSIAFRRYDVAGR